MKEGKGESITKTERERTQGIAASVALADPADAVAVEEEGEWDLGRLEGGGKKRGLSLPGRGEGGKGGGGVGLAL